MPGIPEALRECKLRERLNAVRRQYAVKPDIIIIISGELSRKMSYLTSYITMRIIESERRPTYRGQALW